MASYGIYDAVTEECTVDEIAANAGVAAARLASGLAELELVGLLAASNGRWPELPGDSR